MMPITQLELARRLRAARKACQITQAKAARVLGIPRSAVSQMETGQRGVSGLELHRLAQLYSRDVGDFLEDRFEEGNPVTAMFRAHPELRASSAATASLRLCGELNREVANLHELLELDRGISTIPEYSLRAPRTKWDAVRQGNAAAEKERRRLDLGIAPLPDVASLLGAQGISTVLVRMDDGISGLTLISADGNVLVAANRTHHILRRRFSFAHEYAHVLLDRELRAILSHARDRSNLMEVRANAFAASFLMPAEGVRGYVNALSKGLGSRTRADTFDEEAVTRVEGRKRVDTQNIELHDVVRMAHHFGVSCTAMLYRLKGLDFLTEEERSSLAGQDSMGLSKALRGFLGLPKLDDSDGEIRVHARFVAMAIEAFMRGKITQRKLDELGRLVQISDLSRRLLQAGIGTARCRP
ncbi:MAG: ImmA/IrrE family metallo-endopeptidase [Gemmatimonadetes bacterium]|nr:ImmA/IrrE family metallo-endopeptidase [Gemmatimonadota bacterium]MYD12510.1 ImmA/IrrE family metallo-endopeptidase [Gemmatimonadota bacterium]MYI67111.1 ImmA/IrrE family metallo-endopeptidase [Gemmatimonadota bacterium]